VSSGKDKRIFSILFAPSKPCSQRRRNIVPPKGISQEEYYKILTSVIQMDNEVEPDISESEELPNIINKQPWDNEKEQQIVSNIMRSLKLSEIHSLSFAERKMASTPIRPFNNDFLIQFWEHIYYEFSMLWMPNKTEEGPLVHNACLESYGLHVRALINFFWPHTKPRDTDVVATDYCNSFKIEQPSIPLPRETSEEISRKILHITSHRINKVEYDWKEIAHYLLWNVLPKFELAVPMHLRNLPKREQYLRQDFRDKNPL